MHRNQFQFLIGAMCIGLTGCASTTPNLDQNFGKTVSALKAQQTLYPSPIHNANPAQGMDGKAAKSAYDEYQKSYKAPEPKTSTFTIGVGSK